MFTSQADERIIFEARKHWFIVAIEGFVLTILALGPIIALFVAYAFIPDFYLVMITDALVGVPVGALMTFAIALWFLIAWVLFFIGWTNYYLDVLIITNHRIVDIEQFVLFSRDEVAIPVRNIQDIKVVVSGFLPTLLKFGNLHIQTAGATKETVIKGLRAPYRVVRIIEQVVYQETGKMPNVKEED